MRANGGMILEKKCPRLSCCKLYKSNSFNCNKEPQGCGEWKLIERKKISLGSNPLEQQKLLLTWKYIWAEKEQFRLITDCDLYFPNFWSKFGQILINFEKLIVKIFVIDFFLLICTTQLILECSEYQKNSSKKII